jgi:hypothetical protein
MEPVHRSQEEKNVEQYAREETLRGILTTALLSMLPEEITLHDEHAEGASAKKDEYAERIKKMDQLKARNVKSLGYRSALLDRLLEASGRKIGRSTMVAIAVDFGLTVPDDVDLFVRATQVVKDYCETGGTNVHGGTGFGGRPPNSSRNAYPR